MISSYHVYQYIAHSHLNSVTLLGIQNGNADWNLAGKLITVNGRIVRV